MNPQDLKITDPNDDDYDNQFERHSDNPKLLNSKSWLETLQDLKEIEILMQQHKSWPHPPLHKSEPYNPLHSNPSKSL